MVGIEGVALKCQVSSVLEQHLRLGVGEGRGAVVQGRQQRLLCSCLQNHIYT